jgi:AcrR family transcriptional regulator
MINPSKGAKQAIIKAGRELFSIHNFSALSVRHLMNRACVNHGLFHYYFKTKERFYAEVIQDLFNDLEKTMNKSPVEYKNPVEKLRALLIGAAFLVRDNWNLLWPILKDPEVNKIIRKSFFGKIRPHVDLMRETIRECRRKGFLIQGSDSYFLVELLNFSVAPILLHFLMLDITPDLVKAGYFAGEKNTVETGEIYKRIDLALSRILKPKKSPKP